jgi:hypothetical protein
MKQFYTWDEIYNNAIDAACGSRELKTKDNARYELECIIFESTGIDINSYDVPEDEIELFLARSKNQYLFDDNGHIID